jgi:Tat protein secretion system quality control protein TatD with DNase activity
MRSIRELDTHDRQTYLAVVGYSSTRFGREAYFKLLRYAGVHPCDIEAVREELEEWLCSSDAPEEQKELVREVLEHPRMLNYYA